MEWLSLEFVAQVVSVVACLNIALSAVSQILLKVADAFKKPEAGKIGGSVGQVAGVVQKLLDWVSANPKH